MEKKKNWLKALSVLMVLFIALGARLDAANKLPIDYDEDDYLGAGQRYLQAFRDGDWKFLVSYDYNYEHPPLSKLIYALVMLPLPDTALLEEYPPSQPPASTLPQPHFDYSRRVSVFFGTLESFALALLDPLAGLMLALNNWQIKYTSQIMLEPLPALTSLLAVMCYIQSRRKRSGWIFASALMLGITAAAKYPYCIVGLAIIVDWLLYDWVDTRKQVNTDRMAGFLRILFLGIVALIVFFLSDPRLWVDPFERLWQSLTYHFDYSGSQYVANAGYPLWQPLVWLISDPPWHPGVFWVSLEFFFFIFAIFGFTRLWKKQRVMALWLAMALVFLLVWTTKWPQYILILTAPFSMAAAEGFRMLVWVHIAGWLKRRQVEKKEAKAERARVREEKQREKERKKKVREEYTRKQKSVREIRRALPWLLPGIIGLAVITLFPLIFQLAMSLTDYNGSSIFDGMQGGVWREVWLGMTGQVQARAIEIFGQTTSADRMVHFTGLTFLRGVFANLTGDIFVFDLIWTILSVLLQMVLGVSVALLLNKRQVKLKGWWGALFIIPWAIPEFVGTLIWTQVFDPDFGWAATVASLSRLTTYTGSWQQDSSLALIYLLIAGVWYGFPLMYIAVSAGLKAIPTDVFEAAALDGAYGIGKFRLITWPLLLPLLAPVIILRLIFAFNQFYLFYMMQMNYPTTTLSVISFYIFNYQQNYALSAAINIFSVVFLLIMILVFNRISKAAEGVTYV